LKDNHNCFAADTLVQTQELRKLKIQLDWKSGNKFRISKLCQRQWFDRAICCAKSLKAFTSQSLPNAKFLNFDHGKKNIR